MVRHRNPLGKKQLALFIAFFTLISLSFTAAYLQSPVGIVWSEYDGSYWQIRYRGFDISTGALSTQGASNNYKIDPTDSNQYFPEIAFDFKGYPVIAYIDEGRLLASGSAKCKTAVWNGTNWNIYVINSQDSSNCYPNWKYGPRVGVSPNGKVGVAFNEYSNLLGYWQIRFREWNGTHWSNGDAYGSDSYYVFYSGSYHHYAPAITYDLYNNPFVGFNRYNHYWHMARWTGSYWQVWNSWFDNQAPGTDPTTYDWAMRFARAQNGNIAALWLGNSAYLKLRIYDNNSWSTFEQYGSDAYYRFDTSSTNYGGHMTFKPDNDPLIAYYHSSDSIYTMEWDQYSKAIGQLDGNNDVSYNRGYSPRITTGPKGTVFVVWNEQTGGGIWNFRVKEFNDGSWVKTTSDASFIMFPSAYHQKQPGLVMDANDTAAFVFFEDQTTEYLKLSIHCNKVTDNWCTSTIRSASNGYIDGGGDMDDTAPRIAVAQTNLFFYLTDAHGLPFRNQEVKIYNSTTGEVIFSRGTYHTGRNYCYIPHDQDLRIDVGQYGAHLYGINKTREIGLIGYYDNVSLDNLTVSLLNTDGSAAKEQMIDVTITETDKMAVKIKSDEDGIIKAALDSYVSYTVKSLGKTIKNIVLPYNLTISSELPKSTVLEPTLFSLAGTARYVNKSLVTGGSAQITIKDSSGKHVWGPYSFDNIVDRGEFGLMLGGSNLLQLIPDVTYTLDFEFCDVASFDKITGKCVPGSNRYDSFSTRIVI